jgi:hypothetical protein
MGGVAVARARLPTAPGAAEPTWQAPGKELTYLNFFPGIVSPIEESPP